MGGAESRGVGNARPPYSPICGEGAAQATGIGVKAGASIEGRASLDNELAGREIPPVLENQRISLCETLDRVLNTGVVVHGDITISVANIDLIYISLRTLLTSVETARQFQEKP